MASRASAPCALFLALNLLLFAVTNACPYCGPGNHGQGGSGSGGHGGNGGGGSGGYGGSGGGGSGGYGGSGGGGSGGYGGNGGSGSGGYGGSGGGGGSGGYGGNGGGGSGGYGGSGGGGSGGYGGGGGSGGGGIIGGGSGGGTSGWYGKCPRDALKLGVCANVLDLIKVKAGVPATEPCCPLLNGLVDLEAAVCLCTAIKANVLGLNLNIPIHLSLILNFCGKGVPTGFMCA